MDVDQEWGERMNVFLDYEQRSKGLCRIANNLIAYAPSSVNMITNVEDADLIVYFVVGRHNHLQDKIKQQGLPYAMIQIALASTRNPDPQDWQEMWQGAKLVWSYYDLPLKDYYHSPLGANPNIFYPLTCTKDYMICTLGKNEGNIECLNEINAATKLVNGKLLHIDPNQDYSDNNINLFYNQCHYVNGLRHKDGFEMPAAESLLAGVRPIMFNTENYLQWFAGLARFIPEGLPLEITKSLVSVFLTNDPVSKAEIEEAKRRFNWKRIITGFWERLL